MRHPSRLMLTSLLLLTPALAPAFGCAGAAATPEDVGSDSSAVLGPVLVASSCAPDEQAFLLASAARGRVIASSSAFEACLRAVMAGPTSLDNPSVINKLSGSAVVGPYDTCLNRDPITADPPGTVLGLARSNLGLAIGCRPLGNDKPEYADAFLTTNPGPNETLTYIDEYLRAAMADSDQNVVASAIWHEAMHQHGYDHGTTGLAEDCGYSPGTFSDDDAGWMFRHNVPFLVEECIGYLGYISDTCRATLSCKPDEVAIRSAFSTSASCVCAHDPGWHLSSFAVNQLAVATNTAGELEVVAAAPPSGGLFTAAQTAPNGVLGPFSAIPGTGFVQVDVAPNHDGRLEAFAVSSTGTLYHAWQNPSRVWGGLSSLGRNDVVQVSAVRGVGDVLHAFVLTSAGSVFHTWQSSQDGPWSGAWESLGGWGVTAIRVGLNADLRPEVFAIGGDKALYHQWQWGGTTTWSGWSSLGRNDVDQVALANESTGALTAYVRAGGAIFMTSQGGQNGGWGGAWTSLGAPVSGAIDVSVGRSADNHVHLFVVGGDNQAYTRVESAPGAFGGWSMVPGTGLYASLAVGVDQAGRVNLVGRQTNGLVSQVAVP